jgi:hypothetical protein
MSNFKSQAKRKRELAKLDKRHAKDQKRALRKAERLGTDVPAAAPAIASVAQPIPANRRPTPNTPAVRKPLTLAEAAEVWRNTKIVKPKRR